MPTNSGKGMTDLAKQIEALAGSLESLQLDDLTGIWLEVAEVQFDGAGKRLRILLNADQAQPRRLWWPVAEDPLGTGKGALDTYKQILGEMDKKRVVLARLGCDRRTDRQLHCIAFRFQSAEVGSRTL